MMPLLTRDKLLAKDKIKVVKVDLGGGDFVYVKQMTAKERDRFEASIIQAVQDSKGNIIDYKRNLEDFRAKLAVQSICDENGDLILKPADYKILSENISAAKLEKIVNVIQKINGMTEEDQENLLKSSAADRKGSTISDLQGN